MIGWLQGRIVDARPDRVLLDVGGVGYELRITLGTFYAVGQAGAATQPVTLFVHTHVRESAIELFGFADPEERSLFEELIAISGVGPRLALAVLSGTGAAELRQVAAGGDRARLERIPGVGRKTAERVLLELRDRFERGERRRRGGRAGATAVASPEGGSGLRADAVSALVNLGYGDDPACRAVDAAIEEEGGQPTLETVLRRALGRLSR